MNRLYDIDDFITDHPIIIGAVFTILGIISTAGLIMAVHFGNVQYSEYQMKLRIEETKQKAVICQETGYCNSKNINIDYQKEVKNEKER